MSVFYNILKGVKASLIALDLATIGDNVAIRKRISYFKGHDILPMIQVAPAGPKQIAGLHFPDGVWYEYPVTVAMILETGYTPEDLESQFNRYEAIEDELFYTGATGVASVFEVSYNPNPTFDIPLLPDGYELSVQIFTYRTAQTRRIS